MKIYDFNTPIDRRGTHCVKFDALKDMYGREDLLSLWVADMDFATPDFIIDALKRRLDHPVLGYPVQYDGYWQSVVNWIRSRHGWQVEREWMRYIPGIVKGIGMVVNVFTKPGDKIIIQPPVYHPFRLVPEHNDREIVMNPLRWVGDTYEMDFEQLEQVIDDKCKILILGYKNVGRGIAYRKNADAEVTKSQSYAYTPRIRSFTQSPVAKVSKPAFSNVFNACKTSLSNLIMICIPLHLFFT